MTSLLTYCDKIAKEKGYEFVVRDRLGYFSKGYTMHHDTGGKKFKRTCYCWDIENEPEKGIRWIEQA